MRLLFATGNRGKLAEARALLKGNELEVVAPEAVPAALGVPPQVDESAADYQGNALLKALAYLRWARMPVFADDTGLEVQALGGAPGVHSARYAGPGCDGRANNEKLLRALEGRGDRRARFVCILCCCGITDEPLFVKGMLEGRIAEAPRGTGGFGYDVLFEVGESGKTLAELKDGSTPVETHRTRALQALIRAISHHAPGRRAN